MSTPSDQSPICGPPAYCGPNYQDDNLGGPTPSSDFSLGAYGLGLEMPHNAPTPPSSVDSEPLIRCASMETSPPPQSLMPPGTESFSHSLNNSPYANNGYFSTFDPANFEHATAATPAPTSAPATPSLNDHSTSLSACTKLVQYLDRTHHEVAGSFENALAAARTAAAEIARLASRPECRGSASCLLLLSIAFGQVVALFETGVGAASPGALAMGGGGVFPIDADPRSVLRGHVLGRELRRAAQVLDALRAALANPILGASLPIVPVPWAAEMMARLEALTAMVDGQWR